MQFIRLSEKTIELRDPARVLSFWIRLRQHIDIGLDQAEEVLNTEDSVVVIFQSSKFVSIEAVQDLLEVFHDEQEEEQRSALTHRIEVDYTTEATDLQAISERFSFSIEELIKLHTERTYQIAMFGFLPGFAYLTGISSQLYLPRKENPSLYIPKGAVAIAESYTGIYPVDTQGGWHVMGYTKNSFLEDIMSGTNNVQPGDFVEFVSK